MPDRWKGRVKPDPRWREENPYLNPKKRIPAPEPAPIRFITSFNDMPEEHDPITGPAAPQGGKKGRIRSLVHTILGATFGIAIDGYVNSACPGSVEWKKSFDHHEIVPCPSPTPTPSPSDEWIKYERKLDERLYPFSCPNPTPSPPVGFTPTPESTGLEKKLKSGLALLSPTAIAYGIYRTAEAQNA